MTMQIHPYLTLDPDSEMISCRECETELCHGSENFKEYSVVHTGPPQELNQTIEPPENVLGEDPGVEYRQFFCPDCGTQLSVTFALEDDPILHDIDIDLESV
jgi:acetone carboxylase gamma subunit